MRLARSLGVLALLLSGASALSGQEQSSHSPTAFLSFIKAQARSLRAHDHAPATREAWDARRDELKANLLQAWGGFPEDPCELSPRNHGELPREGYRIEKLSFQTRPGVWMTANAYVPKKKGRLPAVLCVHGHWRGAKQDPVVQQRCIGLAQLGFFVLAVDAFGAGERGVGEALGEYHGEMTAATLLPIGLPLSGLQVYENMRAVDYLSTRPEVDPQRIGVTGASGGGNQTMYAGAWDGRFAAVVPVCSVGNYQAYLGAACCMCEVAPGALRFTEEGDVLGLAARRGLMVISATRDAPQFSVAEAASSVARAQSIGRLFDQAASVRHTIIDSPHDYNRPMREAMYGWMTKHLKHEGDVSPIAEPEIQTEEPEKLRCFPGDSRPDDFVTIPRFAAAEAKRLLARRSLPLDQDAWRTERQRLRTTLERDVLGGSPPACPLDLKVSTDEENRRRLRFVSEPGVALAAQWEPASGPAKRVAVLVDLEGAENAAASSTAKELRQAGWSVLTPELRATGRLAVPGDRIGHAPDHNSAEWSLWIGRPLLGQWVWDVRRALDALAEADGRLPDRVAVVGVGPAGLVALCAAALDERFAHVATIDGLASFVTDEPYRGQRLGILAPGIVREIGDVPHVAALVAPRPVVVAGGVRGNGQPLDAPDLEEIYAVTRQIYSLAGSEGRFHIVRAQEAVARLNQ